MIAGRRPCARTLSEKHSAEMIEIFNRLSEDDVETYRQTFNIFDRNGDNFIDVDELREVLVTLGRTHITREEAHGVLRCADLDGNEKIDFEEFVRFMELDALPSPSQQPLISKSPKKQTKIPNHPPTGTRAPPSSPLSPLIRHLQPSSPTSPSSTRHPATTFRSFRKAASPPKKTANSARRRSIVEATMHASEPLSPTKRPSVMSSIFQSLNKSKLLAPLSPRKKEEKHEMESSFKAVFRMFDTGRRGKISTSNIVEMIGRVGLLGASRKVDEEELKKLVQMVDRDNDGYINEQEFIRLVSLA